MSPATNSLLSLILIALGFIGIILSFSVQDKKKSLISIVLAGVIIFAGVINWSSQALSRFQINRRMRQIQSERQMDFESLRQRMKEQAPATVAPAKVLKK